MSSTVVAPGNSGLGGDHHHHHDPRAAHVLPGNNAQHLESNGYPQVQVVQQPPQQTEVASNGSPAPNSSAPNSSAPSSGPAGSPASIISSDTDNKTFVKIQSNSAQPMEHELSNGDDSSSSDRQTLPNSPASEGSPTTEHKDVTLQRRKPGPPPQIQVRPGVTVCQNCLTTTTPLWRRDENGQIMCNACGLFLKLHGRRRPISLKTDVIKSRNRSNRQNRSGASSVTSQTKRRQVHTPMVVATPHDGPKPQPVQPAPHLPQPQQMRPPPHQQPPPPHMGGPPPPPPPQQHIPGHPSLPLGSLPGIASMAALPVVYPSSPALSPYIGATTQGMILNSPALTPLTGPVLPQHHLAQQPLSPQIIAQGNGALPLSHRPGRGAMSEQLLPRSPESVDRIPHLAQIPVAQFQKSHNEPQNDTNKEPSNNNTSSLLTRVSELELVNDLLRRRIGDLEASESEARKQVEALKTALSNYEREQHTKRIKVSELL